MKSNIVKKSLFLFCFFISFYSMCISSLAADIKITITDSTTWTILEDTVTEEQIILQKGLPRLYEDICLGWFSVGNVIQIIEPIDFGQGLESGDAETGSNLASGTFQSDFPDFKFNIRIDSSTGPIIAEIYPDSDSDYVLMTQNAKFVVTTEGSKIIGKHTVYIEHAGGVDGSGNPVSINLGNINLKTKSTGTAVINTTNATTTSPTLTATPTSTLAATSSLNSSKNTSVINPTASIIPVLSGDHKSNIVLVIGIIVGVLIIGGVLTFIFIKKKKI